MILERIRQVYPQLTKSQKKLAGFVANSYQEAAFMTASRMARRLSVNEATVIRFAQRLGYQGYPDLIHDVQAIVQEELKTPEGEAMVAAEEPFLTSLANEVESLQRAATHVSAEAAHRVLALLRGTRRIYVVGQGVWYYLAGAFASGLAMIGLDGRVVAGDAHSLALALADLERSDALVGVAGGESPEIARALAMARQHGARTLAVTWSPISEIAQAADLALTCPAGDASALPSLGPVAAFLDALLQALASMDRAGSQQFAQAVGETTRRLRAG
ncbi:MAG TPA: MurR/RpiR family transcriptional regulator [Anaerolineae bacterium]|nr:MurR/RpiR family transcriptional regulator [Anaerolineae bacterium]HOQ98846.1 MurR/RpiR family transcriptional regulator [Anaerolineae bacterium]HPL27070.1 MurR/RpiR family transcriptional regulator [Anaerolineae bacterium]